MTYCRLSAALILTLLIEAVPAYLLFHKIQAVYRISLCNLLTNPTVNLIYYLAHEHIQQPALLILSLETLVVLSETLLIIKLLSLPRKKAFLCSVLFNTASYTLGSLLYNYLFQLK